MKKKGRKQRPFGKDGMLYMKKEKKVKPKKDRRSFFYMLTRPIAGPLVYTLFGLRIIKGKHNMPKQGACIAAGNHIHFADPVFLYFAQKRQLRFMAKAELFKKPFTRWLCSNYGAFPVERGAGDSASMATSVQILKEGKVLGIFPEGTRSKDGKVARGKSGTIHLAYTTGAPIYPFAVFAVKGALKVGSKYTVAYGEPVTAAELGVINGTPKEFRDGTRKLMRIIASLQDDCREYRGLARVHDAQPDTKPDEEEAE